MNIILNELSLNGQFKSTHDFLDNLYTVIVIIQLLEKLNIGILKEYSFFNSQVTQDLKFSDITNTKSTQVRKIKSLLLKLSNNPPFWNDSQKHECQTNTYRYNSIDICTTSLAESTERDRIILSFNHKDFKNTELIVQKNISDVDIFNLIDKSHFLDYLLNGKYIDYLTYCKLKFEKTNLDFSHIESKYGFDSLKTIDQIKEFLNAFNNFSKMSWEDIKTSDGLEYKQYKANKKDNWFKHSQYSSEDIYKFRVTQTYRCFGYRNNNQFFVLRFEIDHRISDKG